jgi:hypothetical protein
MTNAEVHDIPFTILQTHITPNDSKRIKLGSGVGRKPILDDQRESIIVDVLICKDRVSRRHSKPIPTIIPTIIPKIIPIKILYMGQRRRERG